MTEPTRNLIAFNREMAGVTRLDKPTIKILLYTDARDDVVKEPVGDFGLGLMIALLKRHAPAFANLSVQWESRYPKNSNHAGNKIHVVLEREEYKTGKPFDQIWFFGLHQVNKRNIFLGLGGGGPESELDVDEVKALRAWMDKGGGVLMTGDHANPRPTDALEPDPSPPCPYRDGNNAFAGLGRALGRCVPRAGELRDWEGPPTAREEDSNNTQVTPFVPCGNPLPDQLFFQLDRIPQQLILPLFDEKGEPKVGGKPHPLFLYRNDCGSIQLFPDHLHEGRVVIPQQFEEPLWPRNAAGIQPQPRVVAYGLDKRNGNRIDLLAAYDGSVAGVGRIVADSTWHHYFNVNLSGLTEPTGPGSAIDQIGQFYGNLALWLSPAVQRFRAAEAMYRWLAQHPLVLEELVPSRKASVEDKMRAGAESRRLLARVSSSCEVHELLNITIPKYFYDIEPFETLHFPERGYGLGILPSQELLLGCLVNHYPRKLLDSTGAALAYAKRTKRVKAAFKAGAEDAFKSQFDKVSETAVFANKLADKARLINPNRLENGGTGLPVEANFSIDPAVERNIDMSICATPSWTMELVRPTSPPTSARFNFINVTVSGEVIDGIVIDPNTGARSVLTGTCRPLGGTTSPPFISTMSFQFTARASDGSLVNVLVSGFGFAIPNTSPPRALFRGTYIAFTPPARVADEKLFDFTLAIEVGEIGTGNGTQT